MVCVRLFEAGAVHVFVSVVSVSLSRYRYGLGARRCYYGCICMVLWSLEEIFDSHPTPHPSIFDRVRVILGFLDSREP